MSYKPKTVRGTCPCNVIFTEQSNRLRLSVSNLSFETTDLWP